MKKFAALILLVFFTTSCKKNNKDSKVENKTIEVSKKAPTIKTKSQNTTTYLCQINGENWAYTKASGIISTHAKTGKRTAIITFKKKLEKGSESIQLRYDANSSELEVVSIQLKFQKKEGEVFTCFYELFPDTRDRHPESELSGTIDLSDPSSASGVAEIKNLNIKYEKEKLQNPDDAVISITGLKFTDIGYSDIDKITKSYKK